MPRPMRPDLPDTPLVRARKALVTARADFEARKAAEWAAQSAALQAGIDRLIWDLRASGMSVSKICEQYGTKDRRTITDALARHAAVATYVPDTAEPEPAAIQPYTAAYTEEGWLLTHTDSGSTVVVDPARHRVTRMDQNAHPEVRNAWLTQVHRNPEHPAWAAIAKEA